MDHYKKLPTLICLAISLNVSMALADSIPCEMKQKFSQSTYNQLFPTKISVSDMIAGKKVVDLDEVSDLSQVDFSTTVINIQTPTWQYDRSAAIAALQSDYNEHMNAATKKYFTYNNLADAHDALISNPVYKTEYQDFLCHNPDVERELAAFLANTGQETNGGTPPLGTGSKANMQSKVGLGYAFSKITEDPKDYDEHLSSYYCDQSRPLCSSTNVTQFCSDVALFCESYNPAQKPLYYGRGPKQLTYFSNYLVYNGYIIDNPEDQSKRVALLFDPEQLAQDGMLGWKTAIAFWNIPYVQETSTDWGVTRTEMLAMHTALHKNLFDQVPESKRRNKGTYGFGQTINVINGGVECGKGSVNYTSLNRVNNYVEGLIHLNVPFENIKVTNADSSVDQYSYAQLSDNVNNPIKYVNLFSGEAYYNSAPLPVEYYNEGNHPIKIELDYGQNEIERLDCADYENWGS